MRFWKKKKEISSSSESPSRKHKEILFLLAGLLLTTAAILLARHRLGAVEKDIRDKTVPIDIVVPSVPIPAGEAFSEQNLAKKSVPLSGTSGRNIPASEFDLLLGARAKGNLSAGEPILWSDVEEPFESEHFSKTIPEGRRAFTMEVDVSTSFAGLVRPGDKVDLLIDREPGKGSVVWLRSIPVLSVDRHFGRPPSNEEARQVSTVTLSVLPEQGRSLAICRRAGQISWFLRNPAELASSNHHSVSRPMPAATNIEIFKGGIRESVDPSAGGEPG